MDPAWIAPQAITYRCEQLVECLPCSRMVVQYSAVIALTPAVSLLPSPDFFCLYNGTEGISERSGASLDVYAPPPVRT